MKIIPGLLAVVILTGCLRKDKEPSGIIPREEMGNILWDMVQADQFSAIYLVKDTARINIKMEDLRLYQQIFNLHGISREKFRNSFKYYEDRPDLIRTLFDSVIARGNRLRTESYTKTVSSPTQPVTPGPSIPPPVKIPAKIPFKVPAKTPAQTPAKVHTKAPAKLPVQDSAKLSSKTPAYNKKDSSLHKGRLPRE